MTTSDHRSDVAGWIRETYEVYGSGRDAVAMIADPENDRAWIRSDRVQPILQ